MSFQDENSSRVGARQLDWSCGLIRRPGGAGRGAGWGMIRDRKNQARRCLAFCSRSFLLPATRSEPPAGVWPVIVGSGLRRFLELVATSCKTLLPGLPPKTGGRKRRESPLRVRPLMSELKLRPPIEKEHSAKKRLFQQPQKNLRAPGRLVLNGGGGDGRGIVRIAVGVWGGVGAAVVLAVAGGEGVVQHV